MNLISRTKAITAKIISNPNLVSEEMIFVAPNGTKTTVRGIYTDHSTSIDGDGIPVNAPNANVSVMEQSFVGYPVRDEKGEVSLVGHRVYVYGGLKNYVVRETMPDETAGLIVCILGSYED